MKYSIKISLTIALAALISTAAFAAPMAVETADSATELENVEQVATGELAATYGDLTYSISDGEVTITDCNSSATSVVIPETIEGYPVTIIGNEAFYGCKSLTSIEIPDSVTRISGDAFYDCSSLTSIEIPYGVTSIRSYTFQNCTSLESVEIPDSVTSIGNNAFYGCKSLTSIEIPNSVTSIDNYAFAYCESLEKATIYSRDVVFGYVNVFAYCKNLAIYGYSGSTTKTYAKDYNIPFVALEGEVVASGSGTCGYNLTWTFYEDGTLVIEGTGTMYNLGDSSVPWYSYRSSIKNVVIENGVTSIGDYAFYGCSSLTSIEIPDSVTSIGDCAFYYCESLTSIEIPDSVTSIGSNAFYNCSSLESIEIPESVTSIGSSAFYNCTNLESIEIPESVTSIGSSAFFSCSSLTSIEIPNSVTSIGSSAFWGCTSLESIGIPDSVTSIGSSAFSGCRSLAKATVYSKNATLSSSVFGSCPNLTLYGYSGSTTETYAKNNNIPFAALKEEVIIDLGARDNESNIRYVEIGGIQTKIDENNDKSFIEIGEENLLVEIVEKTAEGVFVKSLYYYVDMESKTATKLNMDSYVTTDSKKSIRINNPMGMRFRSVITTASKNEETDFVIDEYGFIVATEDALGDTELNFDFTKYVTGVAYNKESGIDIVFDESDECHTFTGYVKNIPVAHYKTNLVCKTYTKLTVGGKQFVVYGEAVTGNIYDTAQTLLGDTTLDTETKDALYKIILDYESTIGIPGDDLYPEE